MKITVTAMQLASNQQLMQFALQAMALGVKPKAISGGSVYEISRAGEELITHDQLQTILVAGCQVDDAILYSPVIPRSTLDNKVPSDWDGALKVVDDEGTTETKEWQEYCQTWDYGAEQCCLLFKGPMDSNGNTFEQSTDDQLRAWIEKFGGFMTKSEFIAWQSANAPTVETV